MTLHMTPDRDTTTPKKTPRISRLVPLMFGLALASASPIIAAQKDGSLRAHSPVQQNSPTALVPVQKTEIKNQAAYERLLNNSGVTVQWLWSAQRGKLNAKDVNDVVRIDGEQANFEGTLKINGEIVSIDSDRFIFRGTILILDAPDKGRRCERTGDYEFRATGKRKYWRLQQMESCDRLTDYVDIFY